MSAKSAILLLPRPQVAEAETLFTPCMGFVEAFRALCRPEREKRGLELYDISHYARRSESALSKWETGDTKQPDNFDLLLDGYATAFGMATTELIQMIVRQMRDDLQLPEAGGDPAPESRLPDSGGTAADSPSGQAASEGAR